MKLLLYGTHTHHLDLARVTNTRRISPFTSQIGRDLFGGVYTRYTHARLNLLGFIGVGLGRIATGTERILEEA